MEVTVRFTARDGSTVPAYQTSGSAGADICACLEERITIAPGARRLIPTGISVEIPEGFEIQVRPRSGLALKHGVTVLNSPGTIDSDYRGEIGIVLYNGGDVEFAVETGDRIAQLVCAPVTRALFVGADSLSETSRGAGGYGSTGKR